MKLNALPVLNFGQKFILRLALAGVSEGQACPIQLVFPGAEQEREGLAATGLWWDALWNEDMPSSLGDGNQLHGFQLCEPRIPFFSRLLKHSREIIYTNQIRRNW